MKKYYTLITLFVGLYIQANAQDLSYDWHKATAGANSTILECSAAKDTVLYSLSFNYAPFDANPGAGVDMIYPDSSRMVSGWSPRMITLTKISTSGNYIGSKLIMSSWMNGGAIYAKNMLISDDNKLIISGIGIDTTFNFNPGGTFVGKYSASSIFRFVAFYDLNGNYLNHFEYGGNNLEIRDLAIDESNNLYITGYFSDSLDFDFTSGVDKHISPGYSFSDFITKVNLGTNSYEWTNQISRPVSKTNAGTTASYLSISGNDLLIFGSCSRTDSLLYHKASTASLIPVPTNINTYGDALFLMKIDKNGNFINSIAFGGKQEWTGAAGLQTDDAGNTYLLYYWYGYDTIDVDPGTSEVWVSNPDGLNENAMLVKLNSNLEYQWHNVVTATESSGNIELSEISESNYLGKSGNYLNLSLSYYGGLKSINSISGTSTVNNTNEDGLCIAAFKMADGNLSAFYKVPTLTNNIILRNVCSDEAGNVYNLGTYWQGVDFNSDDAIMQYDTATSSSGSPFFLKVNWTAPVGIKDVSKTDKEFQIYPNPANNTLNLNINLEYGSISLYDINGKLMMQSVLVKSVDVSKLSQGMYWIQVKDENGEQVSVSKFVKQ